MYPPGPGNSRNDRTPTPRGRTAKRRLATNSRPLRRWVVGGLVTALGVVANAPAAAGASPAPDQEALASALVEGQAATTTTDTSQTTTAIATAEETGAVSTPVNTTVPPTSTSEPSTAATTAPPRTSEVAAAAAPSTTLAADALAADGTTSPQALWTTPTTSNPLLCSDIAWTVQGANGNVTTWDLTSSPFQFNTFATLGFEGNSLAYNVNDGLLYATRPNEHIYTIDAAGVITDLGIPTEATTGALLPSGGTFNAGTFGPDGTYYIVDTSVRTLYRVDVTTGTYTSVLMDSTLNAWDFAYDPATGLLTTVENGSRVLRTVDPNTGAVTRTTLSGSATGANGAVIMDSAGVLYPYSNPGRLYRVDPPLTSGTLTQIATGPSSDKNDGASCAFGAKLFKTVSPATVKVGDSVTYTFDLYWQGPAISSGSLSDTLSFGGVYDPTSVTVDGVATTTPLGGTATFSGNTMTLSGLNLTTGSHYVITVDVDIPAGATIGDVDNQATLDGLGATYAPMPTDFPTTSELSDATPLTIVAVPLIGVAKSVGSPVANGDGTYNVPYTFAVENTGGTALNNLTLTDNIAGQIGAAFVAVVGDPVVTSSAAAPPTSNTAYDPAGTGSLISATGASLQPGESYTVDIVVKVDPSQVTGTVTNQATAGGTDPVTGVTATDLSDSGTNPATGNTGAPGDSTDPTTGESGVNDPTPLIIPAIGVAKEASTVVPAASGTTGNIDVTYTMTVANTGTIDLDNVELVDDIASQLGGTFVAVTTPPVVTVNTPSSSASAVGGYDGASVLATATALAPGESFTITVTVEVNPNGDPAALPLQNQATATGDWTDSTGATKTVSDLSDDGADAKTDNGSGTTDDPTPLDVAQIGVAKAAGSPSINPDGTFDIPYTFVVENTGSVDLTDLSLIDDFEAQFGTGSVVGVAVPPAVDAVSGPNSAFTATASDPELLDGTGTFAPGDSFTVTVTVTIDPAQVTIPLENQATVAGVDVGDPTNTATDLSDAGSDPEGTNGSGGPNDVTTIASPAVGLAKSIVKIVPSTTPYGHQDVTYRMVLANTGLESVDNISLTDDLSAQLGSAYVGVVVAPTIVSSDAIGTVTGSTTYMSGGDIELLVASGAELPPAGTIVVDVTVQINPDAVGSPTPLVNQATLAVSGVTSGNSVNDLSDSGTDPAGTNMGAAGNTGGSDDPTPTAIPLLSATKAVTSVAPSATAGHVDVTYTLAVQNIGNQTLTDLGLTDDLNATFGGALVGVVSATVDSTSVSASPAPAANPTAFDGTSNTELLDQLGSLAVRDRLYVVIVVEIDPSAGDGTTYENQATAAATAPDGTAVTDLSDSGVGPNSTNEAAPGATPGGTADPTPLQIPQIGLAKSAEVIGPADTLGNAIVEFTFVVENTGSVTLSPITLNDDLAAQLGAAFVAIDSGPSLVSSTATTDPTVGSGAPDLLSGTDGELAPGETATVTIAVEIDPGAVTTPLLNQATATGDYVDPDGATQTATDLSDSGTDPAGGNPAAPGDVVDPGTGASGTDDPTPVAIPLIGVAKAITTTPVAATSGTPGNFDVTYSFVVENLGNETLNSLQLSDDWAAEFGGAFVGVVAPPSIVTSTAATDPSLASGNPDLFTGTDGELAPGQAMTISMTVEIDPDAAGAVLPLLNQATATGTGQYGTTVTDDSDSGTDPTIANEAAPGATPGNAADPTPLRLPLIATAKDVSSPAPTNTAGEFTVDYTIQVENVGSETLTNLSLTDDLGAQLGDAFASASAVTVTNVDADVAPGANPAYDGSATIELLDGTGTLQPGQSFTVTMTVVLTPFAGAATFPLTNQATASGDWTNPDNGSTATVIDVSDAGGMATGNNGAGGTDDPTAIINPAVRVAKTVTDVVANADGTATVTYTFAAQNYGFVDLYGVTLSDDIVTQLGGPTVVLNVATPVVASQPGNTAIAANAGFDGSTDPNLISDPSTPAAGNGVRPGETFTVTVDVTIDPTAATSPLLNQATLTGTDDGGTTATDLSDSGTETATSNTGAPNDSGGSDDPTPLQLPGISVAKAVADVAPTASPGIYDVTYNLVVANTGSETLTNLALTEDLAAVFGVAVVGTPTVTVTNIDAAIAPVANGAFDGAADTNLLDGSGAVAPGQSFSVAVVVGVDANADTTKLPFLNSVEAAGDWTDVDGAVTTVTDVSDAGTDPTSTNEGAEGATPGSTVDPTPLSLPALSLAKSIESMVAHPGGPIGVYDVTYRFEIANVGSETVTDLTLTDDFGSQFGPGYLGTLSGPTVVNGNVDPVSDLPTAGGSVPDLLGGDGAIDPGETFAVTIVIKVDATKLTPDATNTAVVAGVDPAGTPVADISDSGTDPDSANPDAIGNTVDPTTGQPSTVDPTPLVAPGVSLTKQATVVGPAASGTPGHYDVRFDYVVANSGNQTLANLSLIDDLATELGAAFVAVPLPVSVNSISGPNTGFDGSTDTELLDRSGTLAPGATFTVAVLVEVAPSVGTVPLLNQATATGDWTDPYGNAGSVDDLSDSGTDPATGNPDAPGNTTDPATGEPGTNDPTPISIADIGVAKSVAAVTSPAASGVYGNVDVGYRFVVSNTGNQVLTAVDLTDDLVTQLGGTFVGIATPPAVTTETLTTDPVVATAYDGTGSLATAAELLPGESFTVDVVVEMNPDGAAPTSGQTNQATVVATGPDGTELTDLSDSGTDPASTNPGQPNDTGGANDPTPVMLPMVSLAKSAGVAVPAASGTPGNYDVTFTYQIANTGNTVLLSPQLDDDFATQLGAAFVRVVDPGVTVDAVANPNADFDGATVTNMFADTFLSAFAPGEMFTAAVTVEIDVSAAELPFDNQAEVTASWIDSSDTIETVTDRSDSGTDATDTNEGAPGATTGGPNDPTPIEVPELGIAKSVTGVVAATSGTVGNVDVTYRFVVANTGTVSLSDVDLADDLAAQLGPAFVAITAEPTVGSTTAEVAPTPIAAYAGTGDLATSATLRPAQSYAVDVTVEVDPDAATGPLDNQASVSAPNPTDPGGEPITDLSDSGTDPVTGNPGEPGDSLDPTTGVSGIDDPTPLVVPQLALAKSSTLVGPSASGAVGHFDVEFTITAANVGNIDLTNLSVTDDLADELGPAFVGIVVAPSVSAVSGANSAYDGSADTEMLDGTGTLAVGDSFDIVFTAELDPLAVPPPLANQAAGSADWSDPDGNTGTVRDLSDSGVDPTDSNDGAPGATVGGTDDPTPISLGILSVAKSVASVVDPASSGVYGNVDVTYEFVVANTGTVTLTDVELVDNIAVQLGSSFVGVITAPSVSSSDASTSPVADATYDGSAALATGGVLAVGQQFVVTVTVEVDPDAESSALVNQATANGVDPAGVAVTDTSDSGSEPTTGNTGEPGDTVDPTTGASGTDDPTPLSVPKIAVAKSATVVGPATSNIAGNYDVEFSLVVANIGNLPMSNLSLTDDLSAQLGAAFVGVVSAPTVSAVSGPNAGFDGTTDLELLDGSGQLAPGGSFTVTVVVEVEPGADRLENQATVAGDWDDGAGTTGTATDLSDSGTDAASTNESAPGASPAGDDDPTPIEIPALAVAKSVDNVVPAGSGTVGNVDVTYRFAVANTGNVIVDQVALSDDLNDQLGSAFVAVASAPVIVSSTATTTPSISPYSGSGNLATGGVLAPGQNFVVNVVVEVNPDRATAVLFNQATASGTDPADTPVNDRSDSGIDPTSGNGGAVGNTTDPATGASGVDDPTPLIVPSIGVAKTSSIVGAASSGTPANFDVKYTFVVANTGNIALSSPSLVDDFATQLGAAFVRVVSAPVVDAISSGNGAFDGRTTTELLDGSGVLAPGATFTVTVVVEVDPGAGTAPITNQATANGTWSDPYGNTGSVSDLSDAGTDPGGANPTAPGNTVDGNGNADPDDPTPLLIPSVAVAKAVLFTQTLPNDNVDVTFALGVANTGTVDLTSLSLTDDLAAQFGSAFVEVVSVSSPTLSLNTSFDGASDDELLAAGNILAVGESAGVTLTVRIDPDAAGVPTPLLNQATVTGAAVGAPTLLATDASDSGLSPTSSNDAAPGATPGGVDDPTPVRAASFAVDKEFVSSESLGDGSQRLNYRVTIVNTGNVALTDAIATDDVLTQFADANLVNGSLRAVDGSGVANAAWDGSATANVFASGQTVAVGNSLDVTISFAIAPKATRTFSNLVTGAASGPAGQLPPEVDLVVNEIPTGFGSIDGVVYVDRNSNGVQDSDDPGLGGVTITLTDADGKVVATTTTQPDGSYRFDGLPPGNYTVTETQPDGYGSSTPSTSAVTLAAGGSTTSSFGDTGGEISGRVWIDSNSNGIYDPNEKPAPLGTVVKLYDGNGNVVATTTTDVNGNYSFAGLPAGTYHVEVEPPNDLGFTLQSDATSGSDVGETTGASAPITIGLDGCTDPAQAGCGLAKSEVDAGLRDKVIAISADVDVPVMLKGGATGTVTVTPQNRSNVVLGDGVTFTVKVPPCATVLSVDAPGYQVTIDNGVITLVWPTAIKPGESPPPFKIHAQAINSATQCQLEATATVNGVPGLTFKIDVPLIAIASVPSPVTGADASRLFALGGWLLLGGIALLAVSRRRRQSVRVG